VLPKVGTALSADRMRPSRYPSPYRITSAKSIAS
jgi:hypothetical protein